VKHLDMGDAASITVKKVQSGCCDLALSFNGGADWHAKAGLAYARDTTGQVISLDPASGPVTGGTLVQVTVGGGTLPPPAQNLLWCVFGSTKTRATRLDETRAWRSSPARARPPSATRPRSSCAP